MAVSVEELEKLFRMMFKGNPGDHFHQLGIEVADSGVGRFKLCLDYKPELVGNPDTGVIHGGVITTVLDTCCGFAASTALDELSLCPTIDLRIDYMSEAEPHKRIYAEADVYRTTRHVIFTRGTAYQDNPDQPIAYCVGNFARLDEEASQFIREHMKKTLAGGDVK